MTTGEIIKVKRLELGMTQEDLGKKVGVNKAAVQKWESGKVQNIKRTTLKKLAEIFGMTPIELMGWENRYNSEGKLAKATAYYEKMISAEAIKIPVLGRVVAGVPLEAIQDVLDYEEIPAELALTGEYFGLKVQGDSMLPRINENDVLIVRQQNSAESGDIIIALIDGMEATCKKLIKHEEGISLVSFNPEYEPMYFSNRDILERPVLIIGKVIENRQKY